MLRIVSFAILALLLGVNPGHAEAPSFLNDVIPLLTKLGCNQGACHGKGSGQNGFRLSLRGYAPEWDHTWLTREYIGRRINTAVPEESLLLQKPLGRAPHEGGRLLQENTPEYQMLLDWIRGGAPGPRKDDPRLEKLTIVQGNQHLKPGQDITLKVHAQFSDGRSRDVTWLSQFFSNDASVAEIAPTGVVHMVRPGETAVRASFLGHVGTVVVTAPHAAPVDPARFAQRNNFIDEHVFKKLADLHIDPSDLCSDEVFLRRVFLDTLGVLPTAAEVKKFLGDTRPDKRARLIDQVLDRPEFVDFWAWWLGDLLQNRKESDHDVRGSKGVRALHDWLRQQVAKNRPWNELAHDLLTVTGSTSDHPAVGYYIVTVGEQRDAHRSPVVASVAQTFLGTRIGCAQCHNHPLEKYTQDDYYHFAGYFSRVKLQRKDPKMGPTILQAVEPKQSKSPIGVVQPRTNQFLKPQPLDRSSTDIAPDADPREALAVWMTDPNNEYFSGALVNRLWAHFFSTGLVEPIDDLRASNPPTNPELWKALVKEFVQSKFDRKHMMCVILNSRTYQLSSATRPANEKDQRFYSHYYARRLPAEIFLDAICQVAGVPERFEGYPLGVRAVQVPDPTVKSYFLATFGRSERITACACERNNEVTLPQMLHLYGSSPIGPKLNDPQGRLAQLAKSKLSDNELIEEIFLSALSRQPRLQEREVIAKFLRELDQSASNRPQIIADITWAVLNSREFAFNH